MMQPRNEAELTQRELLIAKKAAQIAMTELSDEFYKQVGKTVVGRLLTWIGMLAFVGISYAAGKGWINIK